MRVGWKREEGVKERWKKRRERSKQGKVDTLISSSAISGGTFSSSKNHTKTLNKDHPVTHLSPTISPFLSISPYPLPSICPSVFPYILSSIFPSRLLSPLYKYANQCCGYALIVLEIVRSDCSALTVD